MDEATTTCTECGTSIPRSPNGRGKRKRFCGTTCQARAWKKANPERHADVREAIAVRARAAVVAGKPTCLFCPAQIPLGQKFLCGADACRRKHRNAKQREARRLYKEQHGVPYYPDCKRAGNSRRKALKRGLLSEKFTDREIFDRDGWICQICDLPVDPDIRWPDTQCASLDHIIPQMYQGPHIRKNVRLAHLHCNNSRGARLSPTELDALWAQLEEALAAG